MKLFINQANEDWIVDRFKLEWEEYHPSSIVSKIVNSDIVWIISPWTVDSKTIKKIKTRKVLTTIHHIDFDNFNKKDYQQFLRLDSVTDFYHVLNYKTEQKLQKLTNKKIFVKPFWVNNNNWFEMNNKADLRKKYQFKNSDFIIGSFQRDTEGHDLTSPKLIKGPDIFIELVDKYFDKSNLIILLTGKRRQYIIKQLKDKNINYRYFEMASLEELNEFYNILDLYIVSSRLEGGPQQILECACIKTPIVSTDVGIANSILSQESIFKIETFKYAKPNVDLAFNNVQEFIIPKGFIFFQKMFDEILNNES